jgi:RES domain-containing protein
MRLIRIADQRHPIWEGTGAALFGGRWSSPGRAVIYASLSYSCAMLELLVHSNIGRVPLTHQMITVNVPKTVKVEKKELAELPLGWNSSSHSIARAIGDQWLKEKRSAILLVPSVVVNMEWNAVVNPLHPDFTRLIVSDPVPVVWGKRLFER